MYILRKDGRFLSQHESEADALAQLHRIQGQSWEYAFKYGGYALTKEEVVAICLDCHRAHFKGELCQTIN